MHPVLHQKLDRADSGSVRQTRGGLITTFCRFKTCDKATFALKNCLILLNLYMLCKKQTFALSIKAARRKSTSSFFPRLLLCLGSVRNASVCSTQYQFIYAELCCLFVWSQVSLSTEVSDLVEPACRSIHLTAGYPPTTIKNALKHTVKCALLPYKDVLNFLWVTMTASTRSQVILRSREVVIEG